MDRDAELDAFKRINLSLIAAAHGYEIDRKKSTRHSVLMSSGADRIIIAQNGRHYVYCSVYDPSSAGTVIDFVQQAVEPGCSLGRVRQVLRPFLGGGYLSELRQRHQQQHQAEIRPSETDLLGVAARYTRFEAITEPHAFLCGARGIPFELLKSDRLRGRIRHCPRRGSIIFPHWSSPDAAADAEQGVTGYEIKGRGVTLFSKGGSKNLWISGGFQSDRVLAIAESGLDAVSYLAARGEEGVRVASLSGQMNAQQPKLLTQVIAGAQEGTRVVAAFDNDAAGDALTEKLRSITAAVDRSDLEFRDDRPPERGQDWNAVVMGRMRRPPSYSLKR